jgi:hypothetical protein
MTDATPYHPFAPPPIDMAYAQLLCHHLARVTGQAAHVVDDRGHLILALDEQIRDGWWRRDAIVFTASADDAAQ